MTLSLHRISCLAQSVCQTKLCDFGLVMRDAYFWSQASSLWRWIISSEGSAAGGCTQRRELCSNKVKDLASLRSSGNGALIAQNTQNNLWPHLCTNPTGMEEAVVYSSQRSSDGRPGRVGVLQKWQCQEADTRDWSQLVWAGMTPGATHRQPCKSHFLTPSLWFDAIFVALSGGCWAVVQQEGLGAQLHIRHQDYRPRLLPGGRLRRRDEQVGPLHLWHLRLQPHRRR